MKIQAAVLDSPGQPMEIRELMLAEPRDDEVIVKISSAGICHTDVGIQFHVSMPAVLGHEGTGIVERCGSAVTNLAIGDRVALTFGSCGQCRNCQHELPSHCYDMFKLNFSGISTYGGTTLSTPQGHPIHGSFFYQSSFASHALVSERNAIRLPDSAQHEYVGPLGCAVQTGAGAVLNTLCAEAGTSIACIGLGAVGLSAVMAAHLKGCDPIIAVDINEDRLTLARELGATHTLIGTASVHEEIVELSDGGTDYSFDSAGTTATLHSAIASVRMGGHAALAAVPNWADGFHFVPQNLALGRTVSGVLEGSSQPKIFIPELYRWFEQGKLPVDKMVSFYPFEEINSAISDLKNGKVIKPVLLMNG